MAWCEIKLGGSGVPLCAAWRTSHREPCSNDSNSSSSLILLRGLLSPSWAQSRGWLHSCKLLGLPSQAGPAGPHGADGPIWLRGPDCLAVQTASGCLQLPPATSGFLWLLLAALRCLASLAQLNSAQHQRSQTSVSNTRCVHEISDVVRWQKLLKKKHLGGRAIGMPKYGARSGASC